jgi:hypothetical protein
MQRSHHPKLVTKQSRSRWRPTAGTVQTRRAGGDAQSGGVVAGSVAPTTRHKSTFHHHLSPCLLLPARHVAQVHACACFSASSAGPASGNCVQDEAGQPQWQIAVWHANTGKEQTYYIDLCVDSETEKGLVSDTAMPALTPDHVEVLPRPQHESRVRTG